MSTPIEVWKKWEGRVVDEKFPLLQSLGGSDHSAVFLTERPGGASQKLAIKLISADSLNSSNDDAQLACWQSAAKLSHPHLLRLFDCGRSQLDDAHLLYVVMEYAEENLAELLPLRPLAPTEASEMLPPVLDLLSFLHRAGYAHGRIKPSNIMAAGDQLKLSADSLGKTSGKIGDRLTALSAYDAPELRTTGSTPAADVWSLGVTLLTVLTQSEPEVKNLPQFAVPEAIPQPLHEITRRCLQVNPQQRCTVEDILKQLQPGVVQAAVRAEVPVPPKIVPRKIVEAKTVESKVVEPHTPRENPRRWILVPIVIAAIGLAIWIGSRFISHAPEIPAGQTAPATEAPGPAATPAPAPFSEQPAKRAAAPGSVLHQVLPEVPRSAQNTITGTLKVIVQVSVDPSGNVSQAKLVSAGPSKYFADHALAAARSWKFNPPQLDGQATTSEWVLRFQFKRTSVQVVPAEVKPRK